MDRIQSGEAGGGGLEKRYRTDNGQKSVTFRSSTLFNVLLVTPCLYSLGRAATVSALTCPPYLSWPFPRETLSVCALCIGHNG